MHWKKKQLAVPKLVLAGILFLMCAGLMIGTAWARYQERQTDSLQYTSRAPGSISLWTDYDEATGQLTEGDFSWVFADGIGILEFYLSNSTAEADFSDEDLCLSIRLLGSLSAADAQVSILVSDQDSTTSVAASSGQIMEGSPLFDTFGGGNVYTFPDEKGSEVKWTLEGGALSVLFVRIEVSGLDAMEDPAMLQLQVLER